MSAISSALHCLCISDGFRCPRCKSHEHGVHLHGYIHLVPMIETEEHLFLKTIIPSRKANRFYKLSAPAGLES